MTTSQTIGKKPLALTDMVQIGLFAAVMAVCAWISVPAPAPLVPFTMQTFGVFLTLELLGGKRGTLSILVYMLLGAVGVPVFSGFRGGMSVLFGTTGGYILGFLLTALLYWGVTHLLGRKLWVRVMALVVGLLVCYLFGTIWFSILYTQQKAPLGIGAAMMLCVVPYLLPDAVKLALAMGLSAAVKSRVKLAAHD